MSRVATLSAPATVARSSAAAPAVAALQAAGLRLWARGQAVLRERAEQHKIARVRRLAERLEAVDRGVAADLRAAVDRYEFEHQG